MGNLLGGGGGGGSGSNDLVLAMQNNGIQTLSGHGHQSTSGNYGLGPELQCCDPVVDLTTLLGAIGAIAGLALFLRQAVIDNNIMGGKSFQTFFEIFSNGVALKVLQGMLQFSFWIIQQLKIFL